MTKRNILVEADKLLLKHEVTELPLTFETLKHIANRSGWLLAAYQNSGNLLKACGAEEIARKYPAFTMRYDGKVMIFYDEEIPYEAKIQIICHEFGHIVLNHTADENIIGLNRDPSITAIQESEADDFATEMLAPACVMKSLGIASANDLIKTGLLTSEQALTHIDNILSNLPPAKAEKLLCDGMVLKQNFAPKREKHIGSVLKSAAAFLTGIIVCAGVMMYQNTLSRANVPETQVTEEIVESIETIETPEPAATEPETSEATSVPTQEHSQPESTSSSTTPIPQITTQPPITLPPQTTATPAATPKVTQTTTTTEPQREPVIIPSSETVYITPHFGTKYHKLECYHIAGKGNLIELTIEQAEQAGYEPCKDCF